VRHVVGLIEKPAGPGFEEREQESCADAGQSEPVGQPEVFGIERGQGDQQPAQDGVAGELNQCVGEAMRDCDAGGVGGEECIADAKPAAGPEQGYGELDEGIAQADPGLAGAAAAAEENPTEQGQVFPPGEGVFAVAAMGAWRDDAFAFRKTGEEDVEEAAEGEAQQRGEDGAGDLELARYFGRLLRF
jgi:hypothetical protein